MVLARALSEPEPEEVPDIFSRSFFPVLDDIQILCLHWPQNSSLQCVLAFGRHTECATLIVNARPGMNQR